MYPWMTMTIIYISSFSKGIDIDVDNVRPEQELRKLIKNKLKNIMLT